MICQVIGLLSCRPGLSRLRSAVHYWKWPAFVNKQHLLIPSSWSYQYSTNQQNTILRPPYKYHQHIERYFIMELSFFMKMHQNCCWRVIVMHGQVESNPCTMAVIAVHLYQVERWSVHTACRSAAVYAGRGHYWNQMRLVGDGAGGG